MDKLDKMFNKQLELQKRLAKELNIELGKYYHFAGSLHLYENQFKKVKELLKNE